MSTRDDDALTMFAIAGVVVIGVGSWFAAQFGLDLKTAITVMFYHIIFIIGLCGALYLCHKGEIRFVYLLPISVACYLICWSPAANFWSDMATGGFGVEQLWYATGWVQFLISLVILGVGYGAIYHFDSDNRY